ncbi:MAG: cyclic nucleotide-binding domain-containing protein [Saprospiraceae bacterium]|nr:cyclic nucleotide-binding domain-containing protein [Saprospiraceae bacterium]
MNASVARVILQSHGVFSSLTENQWDLLSQNVKQQSFLKNRMIFNVGDPSEYVYLVEKGSVKIGSYSGHDKIMVKEIAYTGDFFGENIFSQGSQRKDFAETTSDSRVICIPMKIFKEILIENSTFLMY